MVALNAHAAAMIGVDRRHCETEEQGMPQSADAQGFRSWKARAISPDECELAAINLSVALGAAYAVCAQLAARSRMQAAVEPTYRRNARAAFLHSAARFLYQARVVLDPGVDIDDWRDPIAGLIQLGTSQAVPCPQPAIAIDEQAVLAEAMSMLASEAAALAIQASGPMAAVVATVQGCIKAAASQLRAPELLGRPADADGIPRLMTGDLPHSHD
jgi:hypothetical protein